MPPEQTNSAAADQNVSGDARIHRERVHGNFTHTHTNNSRRISELSGETSAQYLCMTEMYCCTIEGFYSYVIVRERVDSVCIACWGLVVPS